VSNVLIPLTDADCITLLESTDFGRICVMHDGYPLAFPVNYRLVELAGEPVLAIRTRPGNSVDHVGEHVSFEIDGVGPGRDSGWSVIVRGRLEPVSPGADLDSYPMITSQRDAWRVVVPTNITGRGVRADPARWSFNPAGYL
jgi:pyridoxamine 5'-phosphate oxidase-like protein